MDIYKNAMDLLIQGQSSNRLSNQSLSPAGGQLHQTRLEAANNEKKWLVSVNVTESQCVTQSQEAGFEKYIQIKSYNEEMLLIGNQNEGIKGLYSSTVVISVNRNHSSVELLNVFQTAQLVDSVSVIQIVDDGQARRVNDNLFFSKCKLVKVESNQNGLVFHFKYGKRSETFGIQEKTNAPEKTKGEKIVFEPLKSLSSLSALQAALNLLAGNWGIILGLSDPILLTLYSAMPTFLGLKVVFESLNLLMKELVQEKYMEAASLIPSIKLNEELLNQVIAKINSVFAMFNNVTENGAGVVNAVQNGDVDEVASGTKGAASGVEELTGVGVGTDKVFDGVDKAKDGVNQED